MEEFKNTVANGACRSAFREEDEAITTKRAREIASNWYDGKWSGLYKIACNEKHDRLSLEDWERAIGEAHDEWGICRTSGDYNNARSLEALREWCYRQRDKCLARTAKAGEKAIRDQE